MSLAKQITSVGIYNTNFTNGNATATDWDAGYAANTVYEVNTQNYNVEITPEFYTGNSFDKALSGKLRQNLRGYRTRITINYGSSLQQTVIRNLFNDLAVAFITNNVDSVTFHPDNNAKSNNFEVVLDTSQYSSNFDNTVASFVPSITLVGLEEITSIPSYLEGP